MQETFHQYHLITELANKYSHSTYLASPTNEPERQVVLTVFSASLFRFPHERKKLLQKAQLLKKLQHVHLVSILDIGIEKEQAFVVREYLPKGSLRSHLKKLSSDHLELREALTLVSQVGEVLTYAHGHDLVHGNLKPENMLFDANDQIILTDFTLMSRKDALIRDQTAEEYAFCYMAPEQFVGTCDARSDQYALGCLAYELITGRVPFATQSLASMMGQPSHKAPAPLSESVADLPPSLETAVLKALAKDPDERFFDFALFLEVIQAVLSLPPAFPLFRSPSSEKKRTISHGVPATIIEIHEDATRRPATRAPERSGTTSQDEACALMVETMMASEDFPDEQARDTPITEQEPETLWLTDPFEEEEDLPARVDASSPEFTSRTQRHGPMRVFVQHGRRRALELALVLSVIVAVVCSALWASGIVTPQTISDTTGKIIQIVARGTKNMPIAQATNTVAAQPSDQPTAMATAQLPTRDTVLQPSPLTPSISTPTGRAPPTNVAPPVGGAPPAPTPTPAISYEAEDPQNTLAGGAQVIGCYVCSGGKRVGYIGLNAGVVGTLQFNNVNKNSGGQYTLTIYYMIVGSDKLTMYISVNGGPAVVLNVPSTTNGDTVGTASITVSLNVGNNTIKFSNPSAPAPDIDRIVV